jgi:uncharacterized protein YyaL (SSP411 family)
VNRLAEETSPYLLQHAGNPVDWYPWGAEALGRARAEDRPILLSIGYAACHWCHVMERESFEDEATAALMNERFVNVKVDREERPDLDAIYMDAVVALTGHGGWPMTVFLTPDGEPFYGGTYFPPESRHGLPAFRDVLHAVSGAYRDQRDDVVRAAGQLVAHIRSSPVAPAAGELSEAMLEDAIRVLRPQFDARNGGWGGAPKFPPASVLELLLRRGEREMTAKTLDAMAEGGMYDVLGGGFHRYSVDARWLVPHFEKMLYDNALLVPAYLHGWLVLGNEAYRRVAEETVDYLLRELRLEGGGFASAQDADTDGVEGLTYTWTEAELAGEDARLEPFEDGRSIIRPRPADDVRGRLHARRLDREYPLRDDKAIAAWNGLALAALAEAGRRLERPDVIDAARELGAFLLGPLSDGERLHRTWRNGVAKGTGYLEDYAAVAHGLYELHVATGELRWLEQALRLARLALELFADPEGGGFFQTPVDGERLVARKKELDDNPTPSGNSLLAYVLLRLARIYGDAELESHAVGVLRLAAASAVRVPSAFGWLLCALDLHFAPPRELAVVAPADGELARAALAPYAPNTVVAFGPAEGVPLLEGKGTVDGRPAVYACERFACQAPVTDVSGLERSA